MYHNMISRKGNYHEDISFVSINKTRINEIIHKMITEDEKFEDYYIYKDIFNKLYNDISEIDNGIDVSQNTIQPVYEITETDYKYFKTTNVKNKKIVDIMIKKEIK